MIRTKYLLVAVLVCMLGIFSVGLFSVTTNTGISRDPLDGADIFATPDDTYQVAPYTDSTDYARDEFIAKVRDSIARDPVVVIKKAPPVEEEVTPEIEQPVPQGLSIQNPPPVVTAPLVGVTPSSTPPAVTEEVTEETKPEEVPIL